jgi:drug/metabolite transporter (DMT)-like permease
LVLKTGYLYIALAAIFFSTMEIALRLFSLGFNPVQMNFIRFLIGALVLLPFAVRGLKSRRIRLKARDIAFFALTGFICVAVSMTFYQLAVVETKASVVATIFSCNPVFVMPFAFFMLGERVRKNMVISMLLSLSGIVFIMDPLKMTASASGIILTLLASVTFALYSVIGKRRSGRYGGVALTAFSFLAGSLELLLFILVTKLAPAALLLRNAGLGEFADIPVFKGITPQALPGLIYIGVFVTGLGYAFYLLSMEKTSATIASMVFFIKPALAPVLALAILGEPITAGMTAGIALIIAGSLVSFIPGLRRGEAAN